jgi:hypothetical protein
MAMDDLIRFVSDATTIPVAVMDVVGFLALVGGLAVILHDILKD